MNLVFKLMKRALLIGINYIGTNNQLNGCINDVKRMSELLQRSFGYKPENITMMEDQTKHLNPTRDNIIQQIRKLISSTKPGDTAFLHYSGHGTRVKDLNGDEKDRMDEVICPVDSKFIVDDELHKLLVENLAEGAKVRVILDCCHGGSGIDLKYRWNLNDHSCIENSAIQCQQAGCERKDVIMISGSQDTQTSADAWIESTRSFSGALTWGLCESINEATASGSIHKSLAWKDIVYNVRFKLVNGKYSQVPQLCYTQERLLKIPFDL